MRVLGCVCVVEKGAADHSLDANSSVDLYQCA